GIPVRARTILSMLSLPKSIQFATTKLGGSDCIKLDLTNENKTSMTIKSIDFENADGTRSFTVSNAADITTIDGKKAVSAQICFSPTSAAYSYTDRLRVFYTLDKSDNLYSANAAVIGLLPADEQPNYPDTGKPFIGDCLQIREHPTEVVMGGQILDEIRITNVTSSDLTVSATVSGTDANRFTLSKPEFTVPANSTVLFPYAFDGSDLGTFTFNSPAMGFSGNIDCKISGSSQCSSASFHLFGTVLFPPEKQTWKYEIVLPLFPPTETKILLGSNVPMDHEYIVTLYNNLGTKVKIVDYKMSKGEHYEITGGIAKGTIIKPQEQFKISLWGYQGGDPSITDDLLISTENALKTQRFSFVDPNAAAAVSASSDGKPTLLITPNPMQSQVEFTLRNAQAADLIIINELGQEIYHLHSITSQWSWNGKTDAGSEASAGSYVVAIKGSDETGKPFSQTVMLIKQ
ncbi:MAG TPA: hypothetical protein VFO76_13315, partial [Candidatus Kapabacteria bacterium]|nr:hypothetical protein [Candidatus Kapabacteria bacterium]